MFTSSFSSTSLPSFGKIASTDRGEEKRAERDAMGGKKLGKDIVVVKNLVKSFKLDGPDEEAVKALKGINMCSDSDIYPIRQGEFVMIRGPSGGGKTTLLNIIGSIDDPTSGSVEVFGDVIDANSTDAYLADLRLRLVGFVFQTFNLIATMSAFENVELPMSILGKRSTAECRKHALCLLDQVGLQDRYSHLPSELSGGEQQRVAIARALANDPQILLLDEPTGDLDSKSTIDIMDILYNINRMRGTTCVMVTHNPDVECYADRILYVQDGVFVRQVINSTQLKLDFDLYMSHIENESKVKH